jgi:hypothetical protein
MLTSMTSVFPGSLLGMHNPPNRRIRFRTYGGVGGAESRGSPLSRLTASWRGGYQRYIRTLNLTINPADSTACQSKFKLLQLIYLNRGCAHGPMLVIN